MEQVKKTKEYTVFKKKSGRYGVQSSKRKWINGEEKAAILKTEGLITMSSPSAKKEEAPKAETETAGEETSTDSE